MASAWARRRQLAEAKTANKDTRRPVVYLRPFGREAELFSENVCWGDAPGLRRWIQMHISFHPEDVFLTFERFVEVPVERRIGPFSALGNPTDYLPPEGAQRTYAGEDWQDKVRRLIDQASCILTVPSRVSESDALAFEFSYMLQTQATDRLFVATSPYGSTRRAPSLLRIGNRLLGNYPIHWRRFAADLNDLGYMVPIDTPAPGTVLGFDAHGRAIEVTKGARTATDYIAPIAEILLSPSVS